MDDALFIKSFGAFFAIMNPFIVLPIFLSLTDSESVKEQRRIAFRTSIYSTILCVFVMLLGQKALQFFGININDFRIAGGLVLMTIGLGMLNGQGNKSHCGSQGEQMVHAQAEDISFYPMAFPMTIGPGTITTLIIFAGQVHSVSDAFAVGSALALVLIILAIVLWFASDIGHHMSQNLRVIMTRLMGMILAALAVELIATGIGNMFPGLLGGAV